MAADLVMTTDTFELPEDCGYNKVFTHDWLTPVYGLSMSHIPVIHGICTGKWGWHFKPHNDMDYNSAQWYEKQNLVLSFENKWDLVLCKLIIDINK